MKIITKLGKHGFELLTKISPVFSAKTLFFLRTGSWPNLSSPNTFNEKTTWLKLNICAKNEQISMCADKYAVRKYVKQKGCGEILNTLYGVYEDFDDIDFNKIPEQFALKCTHGCAYNAICADRQRFDIEKVRKKVKYWMNEKYGAATTELHYMRIKPRIVIEKYLCGQNGKMPLDYKFYATRGSVFAILVCSEREKNLRLNYFDQDWNELPFAKASWTGMRKIKKPKNFDKMIAYAEKLSRDFDFVRVDLYNDAGKIIFGELTFTPACCCAPYYSREGDITLGKMLELSKCKS